MPATKQSSSPRVQIVGARRNRARVAVSILVIVLVLAIGAAVILIGGMSIPFIGDDETPEDTVAGMIEAFVAQDLEALEAAYDPDVVVTFDATPVGVTEEIPDGVGRDALLENVERDWQNEALTFTEEIVFSEGDTVTTSLIITFPNGEFTRHEVTYHVSGEGQILREEHVVVE